jgi:hypothetical protein
VASAQDPTDIQEDHGDEGDEEVQKDALAEGVDVKDMARRRLRALRVALFLAVWCGTAAAEPTGDERPARSEYRFYAGVRHQGELFTANTLTAGRLALRGVDALSEAVAPKDSTPIGAAALRSWGFLLVDLPILSYTLAVPHEMFGHAARHREFDSRPTVHLDLPLPYSLGANHYVFHRQTRLLYGGEQSVSVLGGLVAQEASQRMLVWSTFRTGTVQRGEALIYSSTSLTHVVQTLVGRDLELASNLARPLYRGDPIAYRAAARAALVLDLVDPMLLYSVYASAYRWLVRGERTMAAPSLDRGRARFLATSRTMPVPWGVEHQLHVLAAWPWAAFDLGIRTGTGARESIGVELTTFDWRLLQVMRAGGELAVWAQPLVASIATLGKPTISTVFGSGSDIVREGTTIGGAARVLLEVDQPVWFAGTRLGWKSAGLWGERELAEGFDVALTGGIKLD